MQADLRELQDLHFIRTLNLLGVLFALLRAR